MMLVGCRIGLEALWGKHMHPVVLLFAQTFACRFMDKRKKKRCALDYFIFHCFVDLPAALPDTE